MVNPTILLIQSLQETMPTITRYCERYLKVTATAVPQYQLVYKWSDGDN